MENRAHAFAAGLFVIALSLAVVFVVWWMGGTSKETRDLVLVSQHSVNGLNPLAQVRYRGISAGKVISLTLDPQDVRNILVLVRIDAALPLTAGTTARLNSLGITGLAYVQLEDDGSSGELLPVNDAMPPQIPLRQTLMESLGDQADDIVGQLAVLARNLNKVLDERNLHQINRALENIATASDALQDVPALINAMKMALSNENMRHLQNTLAYLEQTAGEMAPLTVEARALVVSVGDMSKRVDAISGQIGGNLTDTTLPQVNVLIRDLQGNSRQLKRVLEGLEAAPQSLIFGRLPRPPGPGENGFVHPVK